MQRRNAVTVVLSGTAVAALLVVVASALVWRLEGGRWYDVRTASMGRAAPVGTLLLTRPTSVAEVQAGDIITFHSPGSGTIYSHRVVGKSATGLHTRGDVNPVADAWTVHDKDLVGEVAYHAQGLGWLLRGLPLLFLCLAVVWLASAFVQKSLRDSVRVVGAALSLAVLGLVLRPWVGLQRIGTSTAHEGVNIRAVSTGVLPIRAHAVHGTDSARMLSGSVADIHVPRPGPHGAYNLSVGLSLSLWWWLAVGAVMLAPLLWCLLVGLDPVDEPEEGEVA